MVDIPKHDADAPSVSIARGQPAQGWLEAAARKLGIRTSAAEHPPHAGAADGVCTVVHAVRSPHGQVVTYAVAREVWMHGVLSEVRVDTVHPDVDAQRLAIEHLASAELVGAVSDRISPGVQLPQFDVGAASSAAWTLDACDISLYENHIRALLDLPLGSPRMRASAAVTCSISAAPEMHAALRHCFARDPELHVHLYGPYAPSGMTIGHVTVVADDASDAVRRARHAAAYLTGSIEE